ncbi:MAG TPA: amino acid adenylation domain-containing protein, partial [Thermoanaerobaculia bacterium]|nr:amino acid adenylation domain-containing protein [Thermoanaerobaculia bacterium]
ELTQLLFAWNGRDEGLPVVPLHRLFERQVAHSGEAVAVTCEGRSLSYAELNARANHLARRLRAAGVAPEVPVAVAFGRSLDLVVALLAVLKAGGFYVPLDPAYPRERLAYLLADSGASVLLSEERLLPTLPRPAGQIIALTGDEEPPAGEAAANLAGGAEPDNLAYAIYTSGSTGEPKGVAVTHANVARLLAATAEQYRFGAADTWTLFHSYAFDFSVWEIWGALAHGGRLVVVPYWVSRSPDAFYSLLCAEEVTVLNQTPSAFRQLVRLEEEQQGRRAGELALRLVIFGGEALDTASLAPWFARHGDLRPLLVNMYGITETTVHVTARPMTAADAAVPASPIGRPIPDLRLYLLDSFGELSPTGVPAELFVGGAGVARGYLNRPQLTAERFVPDPWSGRAGARLYRSGDLIRRRDDGDLDYLGRGDEQVKVRGFRIELGEIEANLAAHPAIAGAAVTAQGEGGAERRILAYAVAAPGRRPTPDELREFLAARLPEHMVPKAIVLLDSFPMTANGKLDRRALPPPEEDLSEAGRDLVAPRNAAEATLARIWAEVLGRERIGVEDDFFVLGGDSILSIQITTRAKRAGLVITPRLLFQHPTVARLAEAAGVVEEPRGELAAASGPLPLTPIQRWFFAGDPLDPHHYNQAVLLATVPQLAPALAAALNLLRRRHDALRLRFHRTDAGWEQIAAEPEADDRPLPVIDLSALPEAARSGALTAVATQCQASLDLAGGAIERALFFTLSDRSARLLWVIHHLAVDAVSWRVLLD